jgi:uncharacterized membrane protein YoaK (UPF0700 family)
VFETIGEQSELAFRDEDGVAPAAREPAATSPRDLLLTALTFASGAVDAISFIALGKVFTAFMTGNFVFLGLRAAGAPGPKVLTVTISIVAFAAGVFGSTRIVRASKGSSVWPHEVTLALGAAAAFQAAFAAGWIAASGQPSTGVTDLLVGLLALAMGIQSGAVLSLGVQGVFTTAATATLMFLSADLASESSTRERVRLAGVLTALFAGAAAGGVLLVHARTYAPVLPLAVTTLVIAIAWNPLGARDGARDRASDGPGARIRGDQPWPRARRRATSGNGRSPQGISKYPR